MESEGEWEEEEMEEDEVVEVSETFHRAGDVVRFEAMFRCTLFGEQYDEGDSVFICICQDWEEWDDAGNGGPWGWGGINTWTLRRLAGYSSGRIVG
jgi:hypothetical protein